MLKKAIFFSSEPGGVEVLRSLALAIKDHLEIAFLSAGLGAERLELHHFNFFKIENSIDGFIQKYHEIKPDLVITSATSIVTNNPVESQIWNYCKKNGIKSCAFLDQWQNYIIRFSSNGINIDSYPDVIAVMDEVARDEMLKLGFSPEVVEVFGNPYLESNINQIREQRKFKSNEIKNIGFVSEPIKEYYPGIRGYDQYEAFSVFVDLAKKEVTPFEISVKVHPKESDISFFKEQLDKLGAKYTIYKNDISAEKFLSKVDKLYGMSSVMLIQGYLSGVPCFSIQPNLKIEDPLVLTRLGLIPLVSSAKKINNFSIHSKTIKVTFLKDKFLSFISNLKN